MVWVEDPKLPRPIDDPPAAERGRTGLICPGLRIESKSEDQLTARHLRHIPLAKILSEAVQRLERSGMYRPAAKVVAGLPAARRARPGRHGHPDKHYRDVASDYRQAKRDNPRAPIQELMAKHHVSEPTVHRWLRKARERGFLKVRSVERTCPQARLGLDRPL